MSDFREVQPKDFEISPFHAIGSDWMLITAEKEGKVVNASEDEIPNSFLLCREGNDTKIYLSMVTAQTLLKRVQEHIL